jgi:hypothetical protein
VGFYQPNWGVAVNILVNHFWQNHKSITNFLLIIWKRGQMRGKLWLQVYFRLYRSDILLPGSKSIHHDLRLSTVNHDMIHAASRSVEPCWACVIIVDILAGAFVKTESLGIVQTIWKLPEKTNRWGYSEALTPTSGDCFKSPSHRPFFLVISTAGDGQMWQLAWLPKIGYQCVSQWAPKCFIWFFF